MQAQLTLPVLNAAAALPPAVTALRRLGGIPFTILIASNGSTDGTVAVGEALAKEYPEVGVVSLPERGRGGALRHSWNAGEAEVLAYMDVDLSTDLAHLPELLGAVASGKYDLATGSRLLPPREIEQGWQAAGAVGRPTFFPRRKACHETQF